jgi:hypothetical protein
MCLENALSAKEYCNERGIYFIKVSQSVEEFCINHGITKKQVGFDGDFEYWKLESSTNLHAMFDGYSNVYEEDGYRMILDYLFSEGVFAPKQEIVKPIMRSIVVENDPTYW